MDATGLDETLVVEADFTGTTGTVSPGGTVVVEAEGPPPVDAVAALNAAGDERVPTEVRVTSHDHHGDTRGRR